MAAVFPLAFHYVQDDAPVARLASLTLTDEAVSSRFVIGLNGNICTKIEKVTSPDTQSDTEDRLQYVSNSLGPSPLLLVVPTTHNRLRFEVEVSHLDCPAKDSDTLVIHKSYGKSDKTSEKTPIEQMQESLTSKSGDASSIRLSELAHEDRPQTVIVNDVFNQKKAANSVLTVSVWRHGESESKFIFSFQIWVAAVDTEVPLLEHKQEQKQEPPAQIPKSSSQLRTIEFGLQDLRKAFNFNIHDGPEFRTTLAAYEQNGPKLKRAMLSLQDEVRGLESALRRLAGIRNKLLESLDTMIKYSFNPLLRKMDMHRTFSASLHRIFEPFERNLMFVIRDVFSLSSVPKMISYCVTSTNSDGSYEPAASRKSFEKSSKEFYDWLHKYLSNEKDRPESKLLLKRKAFEISKFDYLNALNASSNNQYFNQLLENFFKFSNLPLSDGVLDVQYFRDNKRSQNLLSENANLYLNSLSRFNSEKLQFRQMIEASRTNEELTQLIKSNALNSLSAEQGETPGHEKLKINTQNLNLDMIFPFSPVSQSPGSDPNTPHVSKLADDDQNANFAGILYARGGQGKPGWHKEWVVLKRGQLIEYSDWRSGTQPINRPIDIALASVKPVTKEKRQFCLEIITSLGQKHVFQAINDDERNQWIKALYNAGQLTDRLLKRSPLSKVKTDFAPPTQILQADDGRGSPVSVFSESFRVADDNFLHGVRAIEGSDNTLCADCGSADSTEWISITFLVVICVKCSSCHRNMGSHITKVKSLKLDNFADEGRVLLRYVNNAAANRYMEARVPGKLTPDASDAQRLSYIRQKYEHRAFMAPVSGANTSLVTAVRKIDVEEVVHWLNCGGDPNISLQMSNAQWPEPLTVTLFEYSLRKRVEIEENERKAFYFVISELLLLHGCNIESIEKLNPQVVAADEAKSYWSKKRARAMAS